MSTQHHWAHVLIVNVFDLERDGLHQVVPRHWVTMKWQWTSRSHWISRHLGQQGPCLPPYTRMEMWSTLLVHHARFMKETIPPGWKCEVCYWCTMQDLWKRQYHHWHMEHDNMNSCRKTPGGDGNLTELGDWDGWMGKLRFLYTWPYLVKSLPEWFCMIIIIIIMDISGVPF